MKSRTEKRDHLADLTAVDREILGDLVDHMEKLNSDMHNVFQKLFLAARDEYRRACRCAGHGGDIDEIVAAHGYLLKAIDDYLGSGVGAKYEEIRAAEYLDEIASDGSPRVPGFDRGEWRRVSRHYRCRYGPLTGTNPSVVMTSGVSES